MFAFSGDEKTPYLTESVHYAVCWDSAVNKKAWVAIFMELSPLWKTDIKQMMTMEDNLPVDNKAKE